MKKKEKDVKACLFTQRGYQNHDSIKMNTARETQGKGFPASRLQ